MPADRVPAAPGGDGAAVLWFRRDLRLADHPALLAASGSDGHEPPGSRGVVPLFVVDPSLWGPSGDPRRAWLLRSLHALDDALGGGLVVREGDPVQVVPEVAREAGADEVHVSADYGPYGRRRDSAVAVAMEQAGGRMVATGSPYAVAPGTVRNGSGEAYKVFSPFSRAWQRQGWATPAAPVDGSAGQVAWQRVPGREWPEEPDLGGTVLPEAGEAAAQQTWHRFLEEKVHGYGPARNLPATAGTSTMSAHLKYGEVHPRTLLADLAALLQDGSLGQEQRESVETYRTELAWREFYADVLWHRPDSAREYLRPQLASMRHDDVRRGTGAERLLAWQEGRTGYPMVDAGMRQLHAEAWVHNRVRMIVASFLVKDLHVEWQHGARYFMQMLRDGDLASNNHGWQWVAGSGTDAAPYFRVFNPVTQGQKFDPDGEYVRRYVPELAHLAGGKAHTPWEVADGYAHGYPERVVDHAAERTEALARLAEVTG
ncbi:cryptochrome/photolyase family protein [Aquipuribacter hungaricus]|uniref:Cryptochrome/photolyase family protein n=1 Tax=Aquipuribacter hungaricus TaxID=545624 RepID=A0ABV7WC86_9MICO